MSAGVFYSRAYGAAPDSASSGHIICSASLSSWEIGSEWSVAMSDGRVPGHQENQARMPISHVSSVAAQYVVGIGASAGGLDPLVLFFDNLPKDTGLAFVFVQHLAPRFKSMMGY